MKTIFDPVNMWLGGSPLTLAESNKRPVAIDDALSVEKDSGPVTVAVLANDYDPEGAPLTLISASAALGVAVAEADNTVTYTPPTGISGFDTVVYTIADDLGQTRDGQINVTITEPQLSIGTQPDNTLVVNAETGLIDVTITNPVQFVGTYQFHTSDLLSGPVNLVPSAITGIAAAGQTLDADVGLWVYDTGAGVPTTSWQWLRAGADIGGETGASYVVQAADIGPGLSVRETLTDAYGQRNAESAAVGVAFIPGDDAALIGWWDASDAGTITGVPSVSAWTDKAGGAALTQSGPAWQPQTGLRNLNGLNVLDFTGTHFMEAARSFPASGDVAIHAALVIDSTSNLYEAVLAVEAANDFQIDANNATQFDGRLNPAGIGSPMSFTGGPFSGGLILSVIFDQTGAASAEVFIANTSRGIMGYGTPIDVSAALHVMTNRSKNAWVDGAVAELIITGDTTNRAQHHSYLAAKWGLI